MTGPQELCERALAVSRTDGCVVLVGESTTANVRWADNTLTTNGVSAGRQVTVVAVDGARVGSVSRSNVTTDDVADLVRAAERAAAGSEPADDAAPLVPGREQGAWDAPVEETSIRVLGGTADGLAAAFDAARSAGHGLYGYAEHDVTTTYVASSAGLRLRHVQPDRPVRAHRASRPTARGRRGPGRAPTTSPTSTSPRTRRRWRSGSSGRAGGSTWALAGTRPSCRRPPWPTSWSTCTGPPARSTPTRGARSSAGPAAGPASVSGSARCRSGCTATRPMPGQECAPYVTAGASTRLTSVFDNGLPLSPTHWIRDGMLHRALADPALGAGDRAAGDAVGRTTCGWSAPAPTRPSTSWSRVPTAGCC